jgi:DNA repair exonuclease SbcCD nuclease subunit
MSDFTFIHTADLHLDSPFVGLGRFTDGHSTVAELLREATFKAFDSVVNVCIREKANFLLIAGDIYDGADRSLQAQLRSSAVICEMPSCVN